MCVIDVVRGICYMKVEKWEIVASKRFVEDLAFLQVRDEVRKRIVDRLSDDPLAGFQDDANDFTGFGKLETSGLIVTYVLDVQRFKVVTLRLREVGDDRRGTPEKLHKLREDGRNLLGDVSRMIGIGSKL